ncbi:MAG: threonine/serine exporter [Clostridiales bacterium]|nr:threonine/serine exporter [Clostridiales bacterium]
MKEIIRAVGSSFFATLGFGLLMQAPKKALGWGAGIGAIGYVLFWSLSKIAAISQFSMFFASALASILCQVAARKLRMAAIVFNTMAIIPLVPGLAVYQGMSYFTQGLSELGAQTLVKAIIDISMMALGLGIGAFAMRVRFASMKTKKKERP